MCLIGLQQQGRGRWTVIGGKKLFNLIKHQKRLLLFLQAQGFNLEVALFDFRKETTRKINRFKLVWKNCPFLLPLESSKIILFMC
eukprot:m.218945 g.218945  ORF g.218945 m.218945 type:complete len:85 (+) comp39917_c0_seq3:1969-2223(+)